MSWEKDRIAKAKEIIEMYPQKRSALGPLLYLALDKDGYISNESIVEISSLIGITEVQAQSVAATPKSPATELPVEEPISDSDEPLDD